MSATSAAPFWGLRRDTRERPRESRRYWTLAAAVLTTDAGLIAAGAFLAFHEKETINWAGMLVWLAAALLVAVGLPAIRTEHGTELGMDLPLLLGAALVLGPVAGGVTAFLGSPVSGELRGEVSLPRSLLNRGQTSLSVMAGAVAFRAAGGRLDRWPHVAVAALLALVADTAVNYPLVALSVAVRMQRPLRDVLRQMRFGPLSAFVPTYICFGLLGLLLAEVYAASGVWGLGLATVPVVLARQAFLHRKKLELATTALEMRWRSTNQVAEQIVQERRDERLAVAGGLHDEVLPPLFQVHLMGEVVRRDLESGRLLELEEDVTDLLEATKAAQAAIRSLIGDLRQSPLGPGGMAATLRMLIQQLESQTPARFHSAIDDTGASPLIQHLAYQVAGEALRNASKHARAANIWVSIHRDAEDLRVVVRDDGRGFAPSLVDVDSHFGLQLMRERLEAFGAALHVDSQIGVGTTVAARIPCDEIPGERESQVK